MRRSDELSSASWATEAALAAAAQRLRAAHRAGQPLILPNAWDAASARAVADAGFAAVATSSSAMTAALGFEDGDVAPADEMFAAATRVARAVDLPVTIDAEAGYGLRPDELVARLVAAGAAGCNLEDSDHRAGGLRDPDAQAAWLAEVRAAAARAGVPVVINARIDVHLRRYGPEEERLAAAVRRGRAYLAAGADCVYPIMVTDEPTIRGLVEGIGGPVNILFRSAGPSLARLAELGVARVSFGGGLHHLVQEHLVAALTRIAADEDPYSAAGG
ncbi:MAG TPA: isocitrate lyase/phosphoenolpyruvate mutase family protein [Candidatus Limnocylindrales bacterium]|nr:isocitrate lyase/phosphoenolpyruvate mutase family protein [Candidatus Limnocylindrales bacterium]